MTERANNDEVAIRLTVNEAVVLLEFALRYTQTDQLTIEDQAEQRVLWNLGCILESQDESWWPSAENARAALRDPVED